MPRPNKSILPIACALLLAFVTTGCFQVGSDTRLLSQAAVGKKGARWEEKIEFGLGRLTFGLAQMGAKFVEMPPEARTFLNSVKGAEVTVHELVGGAPDVGATLATADKSMSKRGWYRLVGVINDQELVAVYIPTDCDSVHNVRVAVLVFNGRELVCASARSDLAPLMALAQEHSKQLFPPRPKA